MYFCSKISLQKYMIKENKNVALITGVTGQDGSYLSEFLLAKGYEVHGIIRRSSVDYRERIAHLEGQPHFHLHYADMGDSMSLVKLVGKVQPTEIYNLAAQSHVQVSFDAPEFTADVDAVGVLRILEAVRTNRLEKTCRIYQASTSELYGKVEEVPQNENTPFHPYSPKSFALLAVHHGILFSDGSRSSSWEIGSHRLESMLGLWLVAPNGLLLLVFSTGASCHCLWVFPPFPLGSDGKNRPSRNE